MLLLVLAMDLTFCRYELRLHVGGQADLLAQREDASAKRADLHSELERARKRRDLLSPISRPTPAQRDELRQTRARIAELETRWDTRVEAISEPMPEAAWAARMTGMSEQLWRDIWMAIPLAFWMLARVFSLPMAVIGMAAFRDGNKPRGEAEAVPGNPVGEIVFPVVLRKPETPEAAPKQIAKPSPRLVVSNPPREPRSQAERLEAVDAITRRWIAEATSKATISMGMSGKDAYAAYSRWCEELPRRHPLQPAAVVCSRLSSEVGNRHRGVLHRQHGRPPHERNAAAV